MGSTVPFELSIGGLSALVSFVAAILLGAIRSHNVFPHENRRPVAITLIILTIAANIYLHFAITRTEKNGKSRMLSYKLRPLAHLGVCLMVLAFSLGVVVSKPYDAGVENHFDGPKYYFPTGPTEISCCLFFAQIGLHLMNFVAVIGNRARRETFKDAFGYDGYNTGDHGNNIALQTVGEDGRPLPAAPRRVYVV